MRRILIALGALAGLSVLGLNFAMFLSAAPTKKSVEVAGDVSDEIPAVPYLTLALARDSFVHRELSLKSEQIQNVQAAISQVDGSFWRLRDVPVKQCKTQLDSLNSKLTKQLKQELTTSQFNRFNQIVLQARSWRALVSPELSEQLKLTPEQIARLRRALEVSAQESSSIEKKTANNQEKARSKLRLAETRRFMDILTIQQQTDYMNQLGQPLDFLQVAQVGCVAPELRNVEAWINSDPITLEKLRGKVVVLHFWAFGCINCIRNLPHYQSWQETFREKDVVIIGIHTPETERERQLDNLRSKVIEYNIEYPVVFDATSENWKAWGNDVWPSVYLIDKQGRVRNWWYGELNWNGASGEQFFRKRIEELLADK